MKRLFAALGLSIGLGVSLSGAAPSPAKAPAPAPAVAVADSALSQSEAGLALIFGVLSRKPEAITPYLLDSLREEVTPEVIESLRSQFSWLYDMLGGDFKEFLKGARVFDDGTRTYYREYQLANAANDRAPLLVIQVLFPDSVRPQAVGIQVKSFLGSEKLISGAKTWNVAGRDIDIHSMILADGGQEGRFLAILIHDPDTTALDRARIGRIATPLIREAIARGFLDTATAANGGVPVQKTVGTVFIRKDPNLGFIHARVAFGPEEYAVGGLEKLFGAQSDSTAPAKANAPKTKTKAKAKKK